MTTKTKHNFDECSAACFPGGLACVQNIAENNYLDKGLRRRKVGHFIGYTDQTAESSWEWLNCAADNSFTQWSVGEPDDYGPHGETEDCAVMMGGETEELNMCGTWNDIECSSEWHCACEYNPDGVLFTESTSSLEKKENIANDAEGKNVLYGWLAGMFSGLTILATLCLFAKLPNKDDEPKEIRSAAFRLPSAVAASPRCWSARTSCCRSALACRVACSRSPRSSVSACPACADSAISARSARCSRSPTRSSC